jgi:hypothetical protein
LLRADSDAFRRVDRPGNKITDIYKIIHIPPYSALSNIRRYYYNRLGLSCQIKRGRTRKNNLKIAGFVVYWFKRKIRRNEIWSTNIRAK